MKTKRKSKFLITNLCERLIDRLTEKMILNNEGVKKIIAEEREKALGKV